MKNILSESDMFNLLKTQGVAFVDCGSEGLKMFAIIDYKNTDQFAIDVIDCAKRHSIESDEGKWQRRVTSYVDYVG